VRIGSDELAYVSTGTACDMLGVSRQRIHQLIMEGKLSACMVNGRYVIQRLSIEGRLALLKQEAEEYAASG
jgi:excisionase family DNA binding protein